VINLCSACGCSTGSVRGNNEDNFLFCGQYLEPDNNGLKSVLTYSRPLKESVCFAVFDGMGGEENGEDASYTAALALNEYLGTNSGGAPPGELLDAACHKMNENVCRKSSRLASGRMGSTAAILYFTPDDGGKFCACNLGDSRILLLRGDDLFQLSRDHTEQLTADGMQTGRRKPRLTSYLGVFPDETELVPYITGTGVVAGDQYLICSDGLTDMLTPKEIHKIMSCAASAAECVELLISAALSHGGRDNVTVIICRAEDAPKGGKLLGLLGHGGKSC
jgi:serine/threonine protein phosphatase PrpC